MSILKSLAAVMLVPLSCLAVGGESDALKLAAATDNRLPDLLGSPHAHSWSLDLTASGASLAFASAREKWDARLDSNLNGVPSIHLAHAIRMTDSLGAGGRLRHEGGLSDLFVNAIHATARNLRVRIAAYQRRDASEGAMGAPLTQHSVLLSVRKRWDRRLWTDAAMRVFTVEARDPSSAPVALMDRDSRLQSLSGNLQQASGKMRGVEFDFGMRPLPDTRLEFHYGFTQTDYHDAYTGDVTQSYHNGTMRVLHDIGACSRISNTLMLGTEAPALELAIGRKNWSIQAWSTLGGDAERSVMIAYTASFDGPGAAEAPCHPSASGQRFEPVIEALRQPPPQLSYDPLS